MQTINEFINTLVSDESLVVLESMPSDSMVVDSGNPTDSLLATALNEITYGPVHTVTSQTTTVDPFGNNMVNTRVEFTIQSSINSKVFKLTDSFGKSIYILTDSYKLA